MYTSDDTIVALSTPRGRAGLGVIRLSGPRAVEIADAMFSSPGKKQLREAASHSLHHGWLRTGGRAVDEVVVSLMLRPRSYTGEDVVEISAHGGPVLLEEIVRLCLERGARLAGPGEFTFRAFINGRMDLSRAEAVADVIASRTELAARAAVNQLQGALFEKIQTWRRKIVELLAALELALDYGEETMEFLSRKEIAARLTALEGEIRQLAATADKGRFLRDGVRAAIIGKPNAGKSSLLNALLERERSIVTDIPGTTRDVIEETLDCRGVPLVIMDTAGLREHVQDPVEKIGQERTRHSLEQSDLVLWVLDASTPLSGADLLIARLLREHGCQKKIIIIWNKTDRVPELTDEAVNAAFPGDFPQVKLSAVTREGLDALEETIVAAVAAADPLPGEALISNLRHRNALGKTEEAVREAVDATERHSEEITAFHLREALHALGEITGETVTEEILQTIFSQFCVGK